MTPLLVDQAQTTSTSKSGPELTPGVVNPAGPKPTSLPGPLLPPDTAPCTPGPGAVPRAWGPLPPPPSGWPAPAHAAVPGPAVTAPAPRPGPPTVITPWGAGRRRPVGPAPGATARPATALTPIVRAAILKAAKSPPRRAGLEYRLWTLSRLAAHIERVHGVDVTPGQVARVMREAGVDRDRLRFWFPRDTRGPDADLVLRWMEKRLRAAAEQAARRRADRKALAAGGGSPGVGQPARAGRRTSGAPGGP